MIRLILALAISNLLLFTNIHAQPASGGASPTTQEAAEATGTIAEYTPGTALVLDTGTGEGVHYTIAKDVTFVDKDGRTVEASGLRKNLRVRVHYMQQGGDKVVDKVTIVE